MLPLFFCSMLSQHAGTRSTDRRSGGLFILFFIIFLLRCHETSSVQRVALRRLAPLVSCTSDLFHGYEESKKGPVLNMKYYLAGEEITKEKAIQTEKDNQKYLESGDFNLLKKCKFIILIND